MSNINVEQVLKRAVLSHLNDEELGAYHDEVVDEVARARIQAHLSRCLLCERKLVTMREVLLSYPADLLEMLRTVLSVAFAVWIQQRRIRVALAGAGAKELSEPQYGQTEDGALHWGVVADESGALVVRFSSHHKELEGVELLLKAGPIGKTVVLVPVMEDQVGAEVIFTRKERAELSEDVQLTVDIK